jgi:hypothetical protein
MFRLLALVSAPQLRASWARTLLVIGGTLTGVALIVAIAIINARVVTSVERTLAAIAGPSDLEITLGIGEIGFPEETLAAVKAAPGVHAALPLVRGTISLADHPAETLQLFGADLTAEDDLERYRIATVTARREVVKALGDVRAIFITEGVCIPISPRSWPRFAALDARRRRELRRPWTPSPRRTRARLRRSTGRHGSARGAALARQGR